MQLESAEMHKKRASMAMLHVYMWDEATEISQINQN